MKNGIENGYYHEITPSGFGIAIKAGKVLFSKQSDFQKVEVFETESDLGRVLTLDDLMMTTEGDEYHYHEMIAHIPMMHHKKPESVLVIGGGDGGTVREVLKHKTVKKVVLCEIDGMVNDACKEFLPTISCGPTLRMGRAAEVSVNRFPCPARAKMALAKMRSRLSTPPNSKGLAGNIQSRKLMVPLLPGNHCHRNDLPQTPALHRPGRHLRVRSSDQFRREGTRRPS